MIFPLIDNGAVRLVGFTNRGVWTDTSVQGNITVNSTLKI